MRTVLVFVSSLDGKVTKWGESNVSLWSSQEDQKYFEKIWSDSKLLIMGSNTFNADPIKPSADQLLVIMTREPSKYKKYEVLGQLEFSDKSPGQLTLHFAKEGYEQMFVVGGAHLGTSFLKEQLIDELWLTIEPRIFGAGSNFAIEEKLDINLQLIKCEKVNTRGTLITKYAVLKK
jgi:dihydrofolate reductase